jgi:hypothetical protein
MGYRSDVAACITVDRTYDKTEEGTYDVMTPWEHRIYKKDIFKEVVGKLKLLIEEQWLLENLHWRDGVVMFYVEGTKWYDNFPEVRQFDAFWRAVEEMDGVSGVFVRVGEESGDNVEETFGDDPMYDFCRLTRGVYIEDKYMKGKETEDAQEQDA